MQYGVRLLTACCTFSNHQTCVYSALSCQICCGHVGERGKKKTSTRATEASTSSRRRLFEPNALQISWSHAVRRRRSPSLKNHHTANAWSCFRDLKRVLTDAKLPRSLRLHLFDCSVVSNLLYDRSSWKLTEKVYRKLNAACFKMLLKRTRREIPDKARTPAVDALLRARDLR